MTTKIILVIGFLLAPACFAAVLQEGQSLTPAQQKELGKIVLPMESQMMASQQLEDILKQQKSASPHDQGFLLTFQCPAKITPNSKCHAIRVQALGL